MLTAKPRHIASYCYVVFRGAEEVARVDVSLLGRSGAIRMGERELRVRKKGFLRPRFELFRGEERVAHAEKVSVLRDRIDLALGPLTCSLRRHGIFCSRYLLWLSDQQLGEIRRSKWYSRKAQIDLPEDWPFELRLFVFWMVAHFWRRDAAASGGSG